MDDFEHTHTPYGLICRSLCLSTLSTVIDWLSLYELRQALHSWLLLPVRPIPPLNDSACRIVVTSSTRLKEYVRTAWCIKSAIHACQTLRKSGRREAILFVPSNSNVVLVILFAGRIAFYPSNKENLLWSLWLSVLLSSVCFHVYAVVRLV